MPENRTPAYHNIAGAKYAMRDATGAHGATIKDSPFSKSLTMDASVETQPVYADGISVLTLISDQGYTGSYGVTGRDSAMEADLGFTIETAAGTASILTVQNKRLDLYYEYYEYTPQGQRYVVKVWVLNLEMRKPSKAHNTDTNTATIGEYSYPITVYGEKIKAADGTTDYRDANGNILYATHVTAIPGDAAYDDFEKTVPIVKMAATEPEG